MSDLSADDVEHLPHLVILRTNGRILDVREYKCGTDAHLAATRAAIDDEAGEVIVCCRVRHIESGSHRFRHTTN